MFGSYNWDPQKSPKNLAKEKSWLPVFFPLNIIIQLLGYHGIPIYRNNQLRFWSPMTSWPTCGMTQGARRCGQRRNLQGREGRCRLSRSGGGERWSAWMPWHYPNLQLGERPGTLDSLDFEQIGVVDFSFKNFWDERWTSIIFFLVLICCWK